MDTEEDFVRRESTSPPSKPLLLYPYCTIQNTNIEHSLPLKQGEGIVLVVFCVQ